MPALVFLAAAGGSSALALVNGPVGPSGYSTELAAHRAALPGASVEVVAPDELLDDQHGRDWIVWELRGNRICVRSERGASPITARGHRRSCSPSSSTTAPSSSIGSSASPHATPALPGPCPLISDTARADPAGDD